MIEKLTPTSPDPIQVAEQAHQEIGPDLLTVLSSGDADVMARYLNGRAEEELEIIAQQGAVLVAIAASSLAQRAYHHGPHEADELSGDEDCKHLGFDRAQERARLKREIAAEVIESLNEYGTEIDQ